MNRPTLGFEDAQAAEEPEAAAIVEPGGEGVWQSVTLPLKLVRFQNVSSLHVRFFVCFGFDPPFVSLPPKEGAWCVFGTD